LEEVNDGFDALAEVAAMIECPVEKSMIAKLIITMKTSLVACIMSFSQVEVVEAVAFKISIATLQNSQH